MALTNQVLPINDGLLKKPTVPNPTIQPLAAPINQDEIKRKALANIPLVNATPDKLAMYTQFQNQATQQRQTQNFAPVDTNQYRTESATIDDIAKKYGFDFSRDYANRQAEAEAQARRNANADSQRKNQSNKDLNLKSIDNNLMSQAEGLDRNYFQQYMQQQQSQVNGGMNGGIAADQDLRLAMSRQAAMGDSYRDANLGRMQENQRFTNDDLRLAEDLGLINQQGLARADSLHNDRLMQGAGLVQTQDRFNLDQNQGFMNAAITQRGQNINIEQFLQEMSRLNTRDQRADYQDTRDYNRLLGLDKQSADQWGKEFGRLLTNDKRSIFENDRSYNRDVLTSDRNYNRDVLTSDRGYGLDVSKFDWSKELAKLEMSQRERLAGVKADEKVAKEKAKNAPALLEKAYEEYIKQKTMEQQFAPRPFDQNQKGPRPIY